jgi:murein DD-endopeptidase MepM/ murein hydrolase activator NlpD
MNRVNDPLDNLADALGEDLATAPAALLADEAAQERGGGRDVAADFDRIVARAERQARRRRVGQRLRALVPSLASLASWRPAMAAVAGIAVIVVAGDLYLHVHAPAPPMVAAPAVLPPPATAQPVRAAAATAQPLAPGDERRRDADNVAAPPAAARAVPPPAPAAAPATATVAEPARVSATAPKRVRAVPVAGGLNIPVAAPSPASASAARRLAVLANEPLSFAEDRDRSSESRDLRAAAGPPPQLAAMPLQAPAPARAPLDRSADNPDAVPSFAWPLRGRVIADAASAKADKRTEGIDIAVPVGTPIHAAADGVVVFAGNEREGFGNLVLVRHSGGFVTAYAHVDKILVKVGESVQRGQMIAKSGRTGTTPLLHFEIRKGATTVDSGQYLPPPR